MRRATGEDVRARSSGSTGARNAGRVAGVRVAALVFLLDLAKGALAVALAEVAGLSEAAVAACLLAVVAGHVLPVQLGFRGGRGLSTALGATLVVDPAVALAGLAVAALVVATTRQLTAAGLAAVVAAPAAALLLGAPPSEVIALAAAAALICAAHTRR